MGAAAVLLDTDFAAPIQRAKGRPKVSKASWGGPPDSWQVTLYADPTPPDKDRSRRLDRIREYRRSGKLPPLPTGLRVADKVVRPWCRLSDAEAERVVLPTLRSLGVKSLDEALAPPAGGYEVAPTLAVAAVRYLEAMGERHTSDGWTCGCAFDQDEGSYLSPERVCTRHRGPLLGEGLDD